MDRSDREKNIIAVSDAPKHDRFQVKKKYLGPLALKLLRNLLAFATTFVEKPAESTISFL